MFEWKLKAVFMVMMFFMTLVVLGSAVPGNTAPASKVASADGVNIVYTAAGKGKTAVLFIHGGFADRGFWRNQMKPFSKSYRVIAVDLAGHGDSGKNRKEWSLKGFGEDVKAVMEKEKLSRVILVGNSMGGPVAVEAARLMPDKVLGIIAADTFQNMTAVPPESYFKSMAEAFDKDFKGAMKNMVDMLFHPNVDKALRAEVEKIMMDHPKEMAIGLMKSFTGYDMPGITKKMKHPIRCINGDLYPTMVEINQAHYPDFKAVFMLDTGHYPMLEKPETFNENLKDFIEELEKGSK